MKVSIGMVGNAQLRLAYVASGGEQIKGKWRMPRLEKAMKDAA